MKLDSQIIHSHVRRSTGRYSSSLTTTRTHWPTLLDGIPSRLALQAVPTLIALDTIALIAAAILVTLPRELFTEGTNTPLTAVP